MSATDRLNEIENHLSDTSPWVSKHDMRALIAALRAVLDLHAPELYCKTIHHDPNRCPCSTTVCTDDYGDTYPCPTVRAIEEALS